MLILVLPLPSPGVKASLGLALDTVKLSDSQGANAHKVGANLTFEA